MAIHLPDDTRKQALASTRRYCAEHLDLDVDAGDLRIVGLLEFFLKEIGPSVYNAAIADAQVWLRERLADLEATCYEPEFGYWPKSSSGRKRRSL
jgi:uncharacterized protein (DUF2164 family)